MLAKPRKLAPSKAKRIAALTSEMANLVDGKISGTLRASPALAARLQIAEDVLARLNAAPVRTPPTTVVDILPRLMDRWRALLEWLPEVIALDPQRARENLRQVLGREDA